MEPEYQGKTAAAPPNVRPVELTQYLRPDGHPKIVSVDLPDDVAIKAADMVLSCEVLIGGQVAIYGRFKDEDEDDEYVAIAKNEPGPQQPDLITIKVIESVWKRRESEA